MALYTPHGFRVCSWEDARKGKQVASDLNLERRVKPWKRCQKCGATPKSIGRRSLQRCINCAHVKCADPARYCSIECARADWPEHRLRCQIGLKLDGDVEKERRSVESRKLTIFRMRQGYRWERAFSEGVFTWLARQSFNWCSVKDNANTALHVELEPLDPKHPQSPLWPVSFEFVPASTLKGYAQEPLQPTHTYVSYIINRCVEGNGLVDLSPQEYLEGDVLIPQWPFVFAQCLVMGDINPIIVFTKLLLLAHCITNHPEAAKCLEEFIPPRFNSKWKFPKNLFHQWMQIMYPVIANLESSFHQPCNTVEKKYGHLRVKTNERELEGESILKSKP